MTYAGEQISNAPENNSVAVSFMHLKLRRDHKEDYRKKGESSGDWITILLNLRGDSYFQGRV